MREKIDVRVQEGLGAKYIQNDSVIYQETKKQLNEYFAGNRREFDLPLLMVGTDFQKIIWHELLKISYSKTISYLEISKQINNIKAIRAVALANSANAISIIIPCHRVIGSDGSLTGYAGGINVKKKLLALEKQDELPKQLKLF